jgi:hypothetical protein
LLLVLSPNKKKMVLSRYDNQVYAGKYSCDDPGLRHRKMREDTNPQGHTHVNTMINLGLPTIRQRNIDNNAGDTKRVFGNKLGYGKTAYHLLTTDQNDPMFIYRESRYVRKGTMRNILAEASQTAFSKLPGLLIPEGDTQDTFEERFRFIGWAVTRKAYDEPGSTLAVSVTGSRTVWLGATSVDWSDFLCWRFPSIDPVIRAAENAVDGKLMPNDRPEEAYGAIIERMDAYDVVAMPQDTLTRFFALLELNDNKTTEIARKMLSLAKQRALSTDKSPLRLTEPRDATYRPSTRESYVVNSLMATQWNGMLGALYALASGDNTVEAIMTRFGYSINDGNVHSADNLNDAVKFFRMANGSLLSDPKLQYKARAELDEVLSKAAEKGNRPAKFDTAKAMLSAVQRNAGSASLIALTIARQFHDSKFVGISHQRAPGGAKCDQYC